jgi:GTPase SAR1 family protein
VDELDEDDEI